jgi:hypothetical protein
VPCSAHDHKLSTSLQALASRKMNFLPKIIIVLVTALAASVVALPTPHARRIGFVRRSPAGQYDPTLVSDQQCRDQMLFE